MIRAINKLMAPIWRRMMMLIGRCVITVINDRTGIQSMQIKVLNGEVLDNVERFQDYGFTSVPLPGSEGFAVFASGLRSHGLIVKVDNREYRLKGLANGEVAVYTDEDRQGHGHRIHLRRGGVIEVLADQVIVNAKTKTRIESDEIEIHARSQLNLDCNGHGAKWLPTHKESYTIGATGNNNPINTPEVP